MNEKFLLRWHGSILPGIIKETYLKMPSLRGKERFCPVRERETKIEKGKKGDGINIGKLVMVRLYFKNIHQQLFYISCNIQNNLV